MLFRSGLPRRSTAPAPDRRSSTDEWAGRPVTDSNSSLFERAVRVIPGGVNSPVRAFGSVGGTPYFVQSGDGPYIWDAEGRRYIDYVQSYGPGIDRKSTRLNSSHALISYAVFCLKKKK
mgnify:CR=1 FL=1